ncbi:hypothetical protein U1Q18_021745 [Sarracenia purpurea var. burkii]
MGLMMVSRGGGGFPVRVSGERVGVCGFFWVVVVDGVGGIGFRWWGGFPVRVFDDGIGGFLGRWWSTTSDVV